MHRLNRAEYANAIRDLLALDVDASALLPPDDAAYGFDNIADALGVSPVLLERYLAAAGKISSLAVGDPDTGPAGEMFRIRQDASQDIHIEGLPVGTVGGILAKTTLPLDGTYDFSIKLFRTNLGVVRGLEYEHQLEYTVDGERVHLSRVGGEEDFTRQPEEHDEGGRRRRGAGARPHPAQGRPARHHGGVPRAERRDQPAAPPAVHPQLERHAGHDRASAPRHVHADGSVQPDGTGRHAEPPQDLHLPSLADRRRKTPARAASSRRSRAAPIAAR